MRSQISEDARLTFVVDLDGTICTQEKSGEYHKAQPNTSVIDKINELYRKGHKIVIFTARGMKTYGTVDKAMNAYSVMTSDWLAKYCVMHDELRFGKPAGDIYIDDKMMTIRDFVLYAY